MLNGLFDLVNRLEYLTESGDMLPRLKELVPWEDFRGELEVIYDHESHADRRPFDVVMMFKILILQSLYNLSDDEMEYQIMDRLSFMRFLDIALDSRVPDAKTIWLFRSKLEEHKLTRKLFDKFNAFLAESGFVAKKGQIVDATIVRVPTQRNTRDENKSIREGNPPVENWSGAKKRQKNTDASVHDSNVFEELLDKSSTSRDVYIEHMFGAVTQRAGNLILRPIGISRAEVKPGLRNIAYNMERFCFLMRQTA